MAASIKCLGICGADCTLPSCLLEITAVIILVT